MSYIAAELATSFSDDKLIDELTGIDGETYRDVKGRRTISVLVGEKSLKICSNFVCLF